MKLRIPEKMVVPETAQERAVVECFTVDEVSTGLTRSAHSMRMVVSSVDWSDPQRFYGP